MADAINPGSGFVTRYGLEQTPSAAAMTYAGLDPTDPDSLFAFFQNQMSGVRTKLTDAMNQQEARNKAIETMQSVAAKATNHTGDLKPDSPQWNDFVNDLQAGILAAGPNSKEGKSMQAILDIATTPRLQTQWNGSDEQAAAAKARGAEVTPSGLGGTLSTFLIREHDGPPVGFTEAQLKELGGQLKARSDAMQNDTALQMIRVQQYVEQCSQITSHCSNVMKKFHEMGMTAIENLR